MSSFDVRNYPGLYNVYLPVGPAPSVPQPPFSATPTFHHAPPVGVQAPFVKLPDGSYTTADRLSCAPPKQKFLGYGRHAALKSTVIDGCRVTYYEYPSDFGHKCQIEIIDAPPGIKKGVLEASKRGSSKKARNAAEATLKKWVKDCLAPKQDSSTSSESSGSSTQPPITTLEDSMANLSISDINPGEVPNPSIPDQPKVDDSSPGQPKGDDSPLEFSPDPDPDRSDVADSPSETELRKKKIEDDLKDGIEEGLKAVNENQDEDIDGDAQKPEGEEDVDVQPAPASDDTSTPSAQKESVLKRSVQKLAGSVKKVERAADDSLVFGRKQTSIGEAQLAKAERYDKIAELFDKKLAVKDGKPITIKKSDGTEATLTREQAKKYRAYARQQTVVQRHSGIDNLVRGKGRASVSHGVKSGAKKLGKDIGSLDKIGAEAFASTAGSAVVDYVVRGDFSLEATKNAATGVGVSTVKGVGIQVIENAAHSLAKGAVKELAPQIAKKIPGVSTLNSVYSVGSAVLSANTVEEAFGKGVNATADVVISAGFTALGTMIPIPVVGTFTGAALGSLAIYGKNCLIASLQQAP